MKLSAILILLVTFALFGPQDLYAQDANQVYEFRSMEQPPTFPGGIPKFYEFLGQNIRYPRVALMEKKQGTVKLSFVVEKDGKITNIEVQQKLGYGLDEEAVRVLELSPKWSPGIQDGKPVRVKYAIPIKFALNR